MDITLRELNELKQTLIEGVTDNIFDDGSGNNDFLHEMQNEAYNREVELIDNVEEILAQIDSVEGHKIVGVKQLWGSCWEKEYCYDMSPEDEYNHHIKYIDLLISTVELSKA